MSILTYFAYGSNMLTERLRRRVPSATARGAAVCHGYELAFHKRGRDGSAKCSIVEGAGSRVHGVVFEIQAAERELLDRAEGLGAGYALLDVDVQLGSSAVRAFSYKAESSYVDDTLTPFDWYHALVVAGALEHELPNSYTEQLRSRETRPDDDRERARSNREIIRASRGERMGHTTS